MVLEKQLPGAVIPGIIDLWRGVASAFTLKVYCESFTPAGANAEGPK
jgi:hypothetical protein